MQQPSDQKKEVVAHSIQISARVWGNPDPRFLPADVRAAMNPGPQVGAKKNETNTIIQVPVR